MTDMDDLDDLRAAFGAATPAPDPARKAETMAQARKNFDDLQGSQHAARPISDRPASGWMRGVMRMFATLSPRAVMGATTALVALALVVTLPELTGTDRGRPAPVPATLPDAVPESVPEPIPATPPVAPAMQDGLRKDTRSSLREEAARARASVTAAAPEASASDAPRAVAPVPAPRLIAPDAAATDTEAYPEAEANGLKITLENPVSTFSIDVDTASYAIVRSSLMAGQLPPDGAVRVEEMVNYFPYDYPAPAADAAPFAPTVRVARSPWNPDTRLVHIAIQGEQPVIAARPPLNLVFLIDTSGSMNAPDKLPLLRQSLSLMLSRLTAQDQVAIVTYAGSAGQVLEPTPATDRAAIMQALERLEAGGSTAGQAGLQQAYAVAEEMAQAGEVPRVILATDGDFNVGLSDPDALEEYIAAKRDSGTYLSVMGFGRGNLDDATMQALAQTGNGQAAYIDTLSEAQKVLVDQFSGAVFPIANDVKIQVEFNPAEVAEYRLIGYETRALNREDFNNDRVDAGEIGAGHSVTALYEITPVGSPARLSEPLRYQSEEARQGNGELGFLRLRYKRPGEAESRLLEQPFGAELALPDDDMSFAMAVAGFGQLLRGNIYLGDWSYDEAIALATGARAEDPFGYRAEAVRLMRLAQSLSK